MQRVHFETGQIKPYAAVPPYPKGCFDKPTRHRDEQVAASGVCDTPLQDSERQ